MHNKMREYGFSPKRILPYNVLTLETTGPVKTRVLAYFLQCDSEEKRRYIISALYKQLLIEKKIIFKEQ